MHAHSLTHVPDEKLLADLSALVVKDRLTTAALLAHIAEVDARELYKPAAYSSMFAYCTQALHLGDDVAYKRIQVARAGRRFPVIFEAIADGRLHVSGAAMLAPHLTETNVDEVIAAATHRSKAEIEVIIARLAPRQDVPTSLLPVAAQGEAELDLDPVPSSQLDPDPAGPPAPPPRMKPLAPERYELRVTISQATRDKLERAKALLRHRNPSGDIATVLDRALDAVLEKLEKEQFGATARPRATKARSEGADPHYIPNEVRRAVYERDGKQCTFVSADGVRCRERGFLQLDHRIPVALGGQPTVENVRLLCEPHNQYEAERRLGTDFMDAKRVAAQAARSGTSRKAEPRAFAPRIAVGVFDADVIAALCGMGFKPAEARRAVLESSGVPASDLEQRLRAALARLAPNRAGRSSEAGFDALRDRSEASAARFASARVRGGRRGFAAGAGSRRAARSRGTTRSRGRGFAEGGAFAAVGGFAGRRVREGAGSRRAARSRGRGLRGGRGFARARVARRAWVREGAGSRGAARSRRAWVREGAGSRGATRSRGRRVRGGRPVREGAGSRWATRSRGRRVRGGRPVRGGRGFARARVRGAGALAGRGPAAGGRSQGRGSTAPRRREDRRGVSCRARASAGAVVGRAPACARPPSERRAVGAGAGRCRRG